jgi:hypothetical protein
VFNLPGTPGIPVGPLAGFRVAGDSRESCVHAGIDGIGLKDHEKGDELFFGSQNRFYDLIEAGALTAYFGFIKIGQSVSQDFDGTQIVFVNHLDNLGLFPGKPFLACFCGIHLQGRRAVQQNEGYNRYYDDQNRNNDDA